MKINKKKVLCIAIMTVMLFSTMGVGAFAEVDQNVADQSTAEVEQNAADDQSGELLSEEEPQTEPQEEEPSWEPPEYLANVANVKTLAGHQRVKLSWDKLEVEVPAEPESSQMGAAEEAEAGEEIAPEGEPAASTKKEEADRYIIKRSRNGGAYSVYCTVEVKDGSAKATGNVTAVTKTSTGYYIEDKDVGDGLIEYNGTWGRNGGTFRYKVIAQKDYAYPTTENPNGTVTVSSDETKASAPSGTCVRTSYVKLQLKTNKKLTSHDKKKITKTFKQNSTIYTCSFGVGQYMFTYNDHMFWLNRISTKNQKTGYSSNSTLYKDSAEYFVNSRPIKSSKTNKLIWVSTYTQRLYIFDKDSSTGKWVLNNSCKTGWTVSTGRASAPTIRTIDPKSSNLDSGRKIGKIKTINKKIRNRHNIPYWNCFSSYNAIHGKKAKWTIKSIPKSGGCVRNTNDHAKWVYYNCKNGTGVILF